MYVTIGVSPKTHSSVRKVLLKKDLTKYHLLTYWVVDQLEFLKHHG